MRGAAKLTSTRAAARAVEATAMRLCPDYGSVLPGISVRNRVGSGINFIAALIADVNLSSYPAS